MELENIIKRLKDFGYEYKETTDAYSLEFATDKVEHHILNQTNCSEVPEGLINIAIDMVCAEFLKIKKSFGQLSNFDFELVAQSIKLGDATVQLSNDATPEQKFDAAINYLLSGHTDDFIRYRKMVW